MIEKLMLPLLGCLMLLKLNAQTTLVAGDIAFTGVNSASNTTNDFVNTPQSESNREFCFILLKQVTAGTTIFLRILDGGQMPRLFKAPILVVAPLLQAL
ncbi:hypothetical protein [Niabella hibiscisoli]|uniref:hypothetical protein n=1 Tax=Niabella hibiscisoli TaxID=1825928 RepID=UPI001F10B878|nr:hypothetical protein [Niabella hibiscisoli]MCH5717860.1 hypothetical protein [Niabella hibiscisoli]